MEFNRGIYFGRNQLGDVSSGNERSTLVLGPSRSGKTSSIIIPNLLMSEHSCVITSTKDDVLQLMSMSRRKGSNLLFDPSGIVPTPAGVEKIGYSPIRQSLTWDGAILATRSLVDVAMRGSTGQSDDHWTERASALVAPMMHFAALEKLTLSQLCTQIDERNSNGVSEVLAEHHGHEHASSALFRGVLATEERERSSIWSTASGFFAGMRSDASRSASLLPQLDIEEFLRGPNQLHIVSPSRFQAVTIPLVVGLVEEVVHATYDRHQNGAKLLLALDELANVAPLPRLAGIVSEGGGQGVLTLACLQDLSQARERWGRSADGFLSLFPTALILPGIADQATLQLLSQLAGKQQVKTASDQVNKKGKRRGFSISWQERETATIGDLARGRPSMALTLHADKTMTWTQLTPSFRDQRFLAYLE